MKKIRQDYELPEAIINWGWEYHHLGLPARKKMSNEIYLPKFKLHRSGFKTSPFGIEWMRYEKESPINKLIQKVPHIAFKVKNLDYELANRNLKVITKPNSPYDNVKVAMIEHNGAIIELIEFKKRPKK